MALQPDGRVLIGGEFTSVGGAPRNRIARLNSNGALDNTFDPASGANGIVYSIARQTNGRVLLGGAFTQLRDTTRPSIGRLISDGSLDLSFDPGTGCDDTVYTVVLQDEGAILLGGLFTSYNQTRRVGIARIFNNGPLDTSFMDTAYNQFAGVPTHFFNPAVEPHNFIFTISLDPSTNSSGLFTTNVIVGGGFTRVGGGFSRDDMRNRNNFARLTGESDAWARKYSSLIVMPTP